MYCKYCACDELSFTESMGLFFYKEIIGNVHCILLTLNSFVTEKFLLINVIHCRQSFLTLQHFTLYLIALMGR